MFISLPWVEREAIEKLQRRGLNPEEQKRFNGQKEREEQARLKLKASEKEVES